MYSTKAVLAKIEQSNLTYATLLSRYNEYDMFAKYVGEFRIGKPFKSPLREENNPSFSIFIDKVTNTLLYRDMGTGDCGNVVKFVRNLKGLNTYKEALSELFKDLNVEIVNSNTRTSNSRQNNPDRHSELQISVIWKKLNNIDKAFWGKYFISNSTLKLFKVGAISTYMINNVVMARYHENDPIYAYKIFSKFKIYRPFAIKTLKWRGNVTSLDIQGFEQLPDKGELLIITKSLKDVMVLKELGYTAIAPSSESTLIPKVVIDNLKARFSNIILFYDRDKTGMLFSRKMMKKYDLDFIFLNKQYKKKDISDFIETYGVEQTSKELKILLSEGRRSNKVNVE